MRERPILLAFPLVEAEGVETDYFTLANSSKSAESAEKSGIFSVFLSCLDMVF